MVVVVHVQVVHVQVVVHVQGVVYLLNNICQWLTSCLS